MKLILREKGLEEAELKSSKSYTGRFSIFLFNRLKQGYSYDASSIKVPIKELVYEKSKPYVIGAILYYYAGALKEQLKNNKELVDNWIPEKKNFKPEFIEQILNEKFPIGISYNMSSDDSSAGVTMMGLVGNVIAPMVDVTPQKHKSEKDLNITFRHEAQHVTQLFGDYCLYHHELLKRAGYDFTKINEPKYTEDVTHKSDTEPYFKRTVGRGRDPTDAPAQTGFTYDKSLSKEENEARFEEYLKEYFRDDAEYETWTSDLAVRVIRVAIDQGIITPGDLLSGYLATKFPMFAGTRQMKEGIEDIKALKSLSGDTGIPYPRLRMLISRGVSLQQLAINIARSVTTDKQAMQAISDLESNKAIKVALREFPYIRPKEFMRDFVLRVEEELKQKVEEMYPNLKKY